MQTREFLSNTGVPPMFAVFRDLCPSSIQDNRKALLAGVSAKHIRDAHAAYAEN